MARYLILLLAIFLAGCQNEPQLQYSSRYARFVRLLSKQEMDLFFRYSFSEAGASFSSRLVSGKVDGKAYNSLKEREDIVNLEVDQVMRFFGGAVYGRVLYYRFIALLTTEELELFNRYNLLAVVRSLYGRFAQDDGFRKVFQESFPKRAPWEKEQKCELLFRASLAGLKIENPGGGVAPGKSNSFIWKGEVPELGFFNKPNIAALLVVGHFRAAAAALQDSGLQKAFLQYRAAISRYRVLALVFFLRNVVDEKIDFFGESARRRLLLLL